jgi:predicted ATPase
MVSAVGTTGVAVRDCDPLFILLEYPEVEILQFGAGSIAQVAYRETKHYAVTRAVLERPERMLRQLARPDS